VIAGVGLDVAVASPELSEAVTANRIVAPRTAVVSVYLVPVAPAIGVQLAPLGSQRSQAYLYVMPVPVHVPRSPVSTVPVMGLPMIDGSCVLGGPAADAARTDPARTASATTPTTLPPIQRDLVAELRFGMTPPVVSVAA
jgi:hypothetical protein